jgi:hypothetical protein
VYRQNIAKSIISLAFRHTVATKVLSLRLPEELAAEISAVARADGVSVSRAIREATETHVAARRADKTFKQRLKKRLDEDRELLERLTE